MKSVLLVEDDLALNEAIQMKLKREGCEVFSSFSAEEAIEILEKEKNKIGFIWLDLRLPGMNGIDFLKNIRAREDVKDKKVAIVSASMGCDTKKQADELGVVDYIVKSEHKLEDIIKRIKDKII